MGGSTASLDAQYTLTEVGCQIVLRAVHLRMRPPIVYAVITKRAYLWYPTRYEKGLFVLVLRLSHPCPCPKALSGIPPLVTYAKYNRFPSNFECPNFQEGMWIVYSPVCANPSVRLAQFAVPGFPHILDE